MRKAIIGGVLGGVAIYVGGFLGSVVGLGMLQNVVGERYTQMSEIEFSDGKQILANYPVMGDNYNPQR